MCLWYFAVFFGAVDGDTLALAIYIGHSCYSAHRVFGMSILFFATKSKYASENVHMSTHTQSICFYLLFMTCLL